MAKKSASPTTAKAPSGIPASIQASKALKRRELYAGSLPLALMTRLAALLADASSDLKVELEASRDADGAGWLRGDIRGLLTLTCQRGLHPYDWRCDLPVALRLVTSEAEEERLLETCEPYLVREDSLPLRELVEDEVLLALPMMPRCDDQNCIKSLLQALQPQVE